MVSRAEGSLSRMTSSLLRVLIIVSLAVGVRAAHPRSPENCFCETWSVGNALGALGGSQNGAAFRPGSSYTGGRTRSSAGNTCVSWMQAGFRCPVLDRNTTAKADWRLSVDLQSAAHVVDDVVTDALRENPEQCWSPSLSRAGSAGHWQHGPWCFVEGDGADTVSPSSQTTLNFGDGVGKCPGLRRETCGIGACAPPRASCVELDASATNARVLLANGGFERSEALSAKTAALSGDRRVFGLDKVPVNWFFCSVKDGDTAAAATADSRVRCSTYADTVDKNAGKLPWRLVNDTASTKDSTKFAAELRVGGSANFNRTSLRTQLGSTASLAAGATYKLSAWIRCGSYGSSGYDANSIDNNLIAEVGVEALPPMSTFQYSASSTDTDGVPPFQALPVAAGSNAASTTDTNPCGGTGNTRGTWRELTATFVPAQTTRDTSVRIRVKSDAVTSTSTSQPFSGWVAFDNVTLTRITAAPNAATSCKEDSEWACNPMTSNFYERLREQHGVPFSSPQFAYLINGPLNKARTWVPVTEQESTSYGGYSIPAPCNSLVGARLPGLTKMSIKLAMENTTDAELITGLGWDAASAQDGGFSAADIDAAIAKLRAGISATIETGVLRPFAGPPLGAPPWETGLAGPRVPYNAVKVLDGIINTYVKSSAASWKSQSSEMCALDAEVWAPTLCYMYAWYLNSYSSQSFVINFFPMRPNGAHFGSVIHGDIMTLSAEELTISANWQWTAQNIPPHVFGIMLGGGQNAITNRYLGNLTMRGLSPCSDYFMKMVYAISELPYPCNTILGFNQPWIAKGYITTMLDAFKVANGGKCVDSLDFKKGQDLALDVLYPPKKKDNSHRRNIILAAVFGSLGGVIILYIIARVYRNRIRRREEEDLFPSTATSEGTPEKTSTAVLSLEPVNSNSFINWLMGEKAISNSRVTIIEPIATGGEGTVSLGKMNGKPVAVKVLKSLKEAEHEINIFRNIPRHKNLVRLLGYTNLDKRWSLVMEYCNYRCLHSCAVSGVLFDIPGGSTSGTKGKLLVKILKETLDGLSAIHASRTYHNDIKLENIMLSCYKHPLMCNCIRNGQLDNLCVKICDLGMSKTAAFSSYSSGNLGGTICYVPKERADVAGLVRSLNKGNTLLKPQKQWTTNDIYIICDVYAFAITAWELVKSMLAGREIRVGDHGQVCESSPLAMFNGARPDVSEFDPELAAAFARWWAHDPTARTSSVEIARQELKHVIPCIHKLAALAVDPSTPRSNTPASSAHVTGRSNAASHGTGSTRSSDISVTIA